jgi:hypothetical protein
MNGRGSSPLLRWVSFGHGIYYLVSALWSLVSIRSFQRVTGRKTDIWLVRTVAILLVVIGMVLLIAGFRRRSVAEFALLGGGTAMGLAGVDAVYGLRRRISRIYLLEALAELTIIVAWALAWLRQKR